MALLAGIGAWPGLGCSAAPASPAWQAAPFSRRQAVTASGPAAVEAQSAPGHAQTFRVVVGPAVVLATDPDNPKAAFADFPIPAFIAHFATPGPAAQDVVVVQQDSTGNACDGGPLWLLVLVKGQAAQRTRTIDWCGGPAPRVRAKGAKIVITLPATPPSAQTGPHGVPGETWVFEAGRLKKAGR